MLFALTLLAQTPTIALAPTEGMKTLQHGVITIEVRGVKLRADFDLTLAYRDVTEKGFTVGRTLSNAKLTLNGQSEAQSTEGEMKVAMLKDGTIDFSGTDEVDTQDRMDLLLFRFVPTPAEKGKRTVTLKGDGKTFLDQKIESEYLGPKDKGFAYRQKGTSGDMRWQTDFTVRADGTVLDAKSKFSNFPFPQAQLLVGGTGEMKLREG